MKKTTVYDATIISLPRVNAAAGSITAINNYIEIPFSSKRVYYLYDIPSGEARGGHAHLVLQQLIVAASGSFDIILDDGKAKRTVHLAQPDQGLYVPAGLWRELDNFSGGSICLVLASHEYSEADYIRDYDKFDEYKNH